MASTEKIESEQIPRKGTLYIVSTPIGNDDDITLRALKVLKSCDIVICEEAKIGARTLHKLNLAQKMELLNEQNELVKTQELLSMLEAGKNLSLISDAGTPVFADPGLELVRACIKKDIRIVVVPGVSSIMTAVVRSGFNIDQFLYAGFLSRSREERHVQLRRLKNEAKTVVLLETPYRMMPFLDAAETLMPERQAYLGCNLTMPFETHHYGTFSELKSKFSEIKFKGEFVICFEGTTYDQLSVEEQEAENRENIKDRSVDLRENYNDRRPRFSGSRFGDKPKYRSGDDRRGGRDRSDDRDSNRGSGSRDGGYGRTRRDDKRDFGDMPPRRRYSDNTEKTERSGSSSDHRGSRDDYQKRSSGERSAYSDKPPNRRSGFGDKPRSSGGRDDRRKSDYGDKPAKRSTYGEKSDYGDKPAKRRSDYGDKPRTRSSGGFKSKPKSDGNRRGGSSSGRKPKPRK